MGNDIHFYVFFSGSSTDLLQIPVSVQLLLDVHYPVTLQLLSLSSNSSITSLVAQMVKNLPAVREPGVQSLGQEDPLEKGMAAYSSVLAWRIPLPEEPSGP